MNANSHRNGKAVMDINQMQERVDALSKAMLAKGLKQPSAQVTLKSDLATVEVYLRWKDVTKQSERYSYANDEYKFFQETTAKEAFDAADSFVSELPTADEARLQQFMGALAGVIDLGKDNGIEVEFLNPLQATMKKLSDNILTDQRKAPAFTEAAE